MYAMIDVGSCQHYTGSPSHERILELHVAGFPGDFYLPLCKPLQT